MLSGQTIKQPPNLLACFSCECSQQRGGVCRTDLKWTACSRSSRIVFDSVGAPLQRSSVSNFVWTKTGKREISNMLYLGHLTVSFWHRMWSAKEKRGDVLARSPLHVVQTTALTLCGRTVACLTELLSRRSNIHNWPNNRGEGMSEELAAESADGHRPWLLSECEMPKPDCSPEPGGQRRSRLLSPTQRASKTIWHEDFIQALPPSHSLLNHPPPPKKPKTLLLAPAFDCLYIKARLHCQAATCSALSSAGNNNCFSHIFQGFCHGGVVLVFFFTPPCSSGVSTMCRLIEI